MRPRDARGDPVRAGIRLLVAQAARIVPGALGDHAPPVCPVGRGEGDDRCSPGCSRRPRRGRTDRLVEGEHRRYTHVRAAKRGNLTGPSPAPGSTRSLTRRAATACGHLRRPGKRPLKLHGEKGYDYPICRELCRARNITARIARKGIESSTRLGQYRYVIERCLEWTTR